MTDIQWTSPPPDHRGKKGTNWQIVADALRANPGEWALVREGSRDPGSATAIKTGRIAAFRGGVFEATTRSKEDGGFDIYARFMGEPQ